MLIPALFLAYQVARRYFFEIMNWQIFFSTFVLIFLAELGDKTQLAAMARVASGGSARWTIFLAASIALVLSTLIAVLVGDALTRVIPERYIRIGAGILFIVFGIVIMREAFVKQSAESEPSAHTAPGAVSRFVFKQATAFEKAAFEDYAKLAEQAQSSQLRALLEELAVEERAHFDRVTNYQEKHGEEEIQHVDVRKLPERDMMPVSAGKDDKSIVEYAISHENATINFYMELAHLTPVPALKKAFRDLAAEEQRHLARLKKCLAAGRG